MISCRISDGMVYMKKSSGNWILSVLGGTAVFAGLYFALGMMFSIPLEVAFAVGLIVFGVSLMNLNKRSKKKEVVYEGTTYGEVEETMKIGKKLSAEMRSATSRLMQDEVKREILDLCNISDSMMTMLKTDPKDLRIVKQFITYYLEPTNKIIVKYADLATTRPMPLDAVETLERTESSLNTIRKTFLQQKEKMLLNDMMDLDTEMKVFESMAGVNLGAEKKPTEQPKNRSTPS